METYSLASSGSGLPMFLFHHAEFVTLSSYLNKIKAANFGY